MIAMKQIITSMLDTDLYKLTMANAIMFGSFNGVNLRDFNVEYEFINRKSTDFSVNFFKTFLEQLEMFEEIRLTDEEEEYLRSLNLFDDLFITFLKNYRFNRNNINTSLSNLGEFKVNVKGKWIDTIFWEVPLLATISELYYLDKKPFTKVTKEICSHAQQKNADLQHLNYIEFGTRRRFSSYVQERVLESILSGVKGTSNVFLAKKYGIPVVGTHAHEWFMAIAASFGYKQANNIGLKIWNDIYKNKLDIALTDTFTSDVFFRDLDPVFINSYSGLRQDSGSPIEFANKAYNFYKNHGIDTKTKKIVFSDNLNVQKVLQIDSQVSDKFQCLYGIGTNLTNDVSVVPLNIVMKLTKCNGVGTVKLSDDTGKHTGNIADIQNCKYDLRIS